MIYDKTLYGATEDDKRLTIVFSLMDNPAASMRVVANMTLVPDKEWTTEEAIAFMLFARGFINCAIECLQGTDSMSGGFIIDMQKGQYLWADPTPKWTNIFNEAFVPVTGKVWSRIKGFFQRVFRVAKKVVPVLTKVASVAGAVIPPPAGTVVMAVGKGISTATTAIDAIAAGFQKQTLTSFDGLVSYADDAFTLTYESAIMPYGSTALDIMGSDPAWVAGNTWQVPVATGESVKQVCTGGAVTTDLKDRIK